MQVLTRISVRAAGALAVAAAALLLTPVASSSSKTAETCFGQNATIVGTPGDDTLNGTAGDDVIAAGTGNDTVFGFGGNDLICGGPGDDLVNGGPGNDRIDAGLDSNTLFGGLGGSDSLFFTSSGRVTIDMARGTATGQGNDTLANIETVVGSRDDDKIYGTPGPDFMIGAEGSDLIDGRGGNDVLIGDFYGDPAGNDTLVGGAGSDILAGVAGDDRLLGGTGEQDIASYWYAKGLKANLAKGRVTGEGVDTLRGVEGIFGSPAADSLTGNAGSNLLFGDTGRDKLTGAAGDDFLDGGAGLDALNGGKGQDYCLYGERRASCEIGGSALASAGVAVSRLRALARGPRARMDEDEIDYGENPTCTTKVVSAGLTPQGGDRRRRRHVTGSTPPSRVVPAVHRGANPRAGILRLLGPVTDFAASAATSATWQPVLYRYQNGSWQQFHVFPELHTLIAPGTSDGAVWSDASGKIVQNVSFEVGTGRYAWSAKTVVGDGTGLAQSLEPRLNSGK